MRSSHYPSMDLPLTGILATTQGSSRRSRTFAPNSLSFSIAKFRSENCFGSSYHKPRTTKDNHPVHDLVSGSLPPTRPGCFRTPHLQYLPRRLTVASANDPRSNRLLPTNNRAGNRPCPCNRSYITQHRLVNGIAAKHSPSLEGKPFLIGHPMHGLLWL